MRPHAGMTPPLYLTRATAWFSSPLTPITEDEWWAAAQAIDGLVCETRIVTLTDRSEQAFEVAERQPVRLRGSDGGDPADCLYWEHGYIATTPQPRPVLVDILLAIAPKLGARLLDAEDRVVTPAALAPP